MADSNGLISLIDYTSGFVAHEVKIKGVSGSTNSLKLDFVGLKYDRKDHMRINAKPDETYLFEAKLTAPPGFWIKVLG